jgi:hypothetical protein
MPCGLPTYLAVTLAVAGIAGAAAAEPLAFPVHEAPFPTVLTGIDPEWNFHFRTGDKVRVVAAGDLAYWGRYRDVESGPQIMLTDGSLIRADVLSLDDKEVVIGDASGVGRGQWDESTLPREAVDAIVFQPPADAAQRSRLRAALDDLPHQQDVLLLQNGESIAGTLLAAPKQGRFTPEGTKPGTEVFAIARGSLLEPISIPASKVVAFRSFRAVSGRSAAGKAWLGLADGSLVNARSLAVNGDEVALALAAGGELKTTLAGRDDPEKRLWDAIQYVQPANDRVAWLPHQKSLGYKHIPFLSAIRPLGVHRSVLGDRLRAGGAVFLQGLGMPSTSRVAYDVTGFRKFAAELAIDDAAELNGSVTFKVLLQGGEAEAQADGEAAWSVAYTSPVMRGGEQPLPISVDLKGATRLALIVDFADRGDECDWADWLNARLTK